MTMTPGVQSSKRPRILIVEDDAGMRRSMQLLLQGRGFDVRAYAAADPMLLDEQLTEAVCLVIDYLLGDRMDSAYSLPCAILDGEGRLSS